MAAPNVQITILPGEYSLIHFPPMLYAHFLQPVLQALLPQSQTINTESSEESPPWPHHNLPGLTEDHQHNFLNVSVTPLEASVVCHADWARTVFQPAIDHILETLPANIRKPVFLSPDTYLVLSVISGGGGGADTDIVARILDLTAPLALAGIPIFFISTYYSDFILVPAKDRATVLAALTARGFQCPADHGNRFVASRPTGSYYPPVPINSPASDPAALATLFDRTFAQLKTRNVVPAVDPTLRLVQLSARETPLPNHGSPNSFSRPGLSRQTTSSASNRRPPPPTWLDTSDPRLYAAVVSALVARPRFFSMTLAVDDPPSLLLDRALMPLFGDALVGSAEEELVAISLDLAGLPLEATGIVCGVAGRLVQDPVIAGHGLSYLSTAFAGTVVLAPQQARRAVEILGPLLG
ncbi:hypothetical protein ACHAQH_005115 [Verticillium albo-atrum]